MSTLASASTMSMAEKPAEEKIVSVAGVDEEPEFPEGGLQAWLAVTGSFLVYVASFGVINSFGTFQASQVFHTGKHEILIERVRQNFYETEYLSNYTSTVIAFIGALQITILYVEGLFICSLGD